jgi:hypothetical protein
MLLLPSSTLVYASIGSNRTGKTTHNGIAKPTTRLKRSLRTANTVVASKLGSSLGESVEDSMDLMLCVTSSMSSLGRADNRRNTAIASKFSSSLGCWISVAESVEDSMDLVVCVPSSKSSCWGADNRWNTDIASSLGCGWRLSAGVG